MHIKKLLLALLFYFFSFNTIASTSFNVCSSKNFLYEVTGGEKDKKENPSANKLSYVKKNLIKVCNFFAPSKLQIPKDLSVLVVKKSSNAFFHGLFNIIYIPIQFELKKGATKHPSHSQPIAVHELGHAYFNSNVLSLTENKTYSSIQNKWKHLSFNLVTNITKQRIDYSDPFTGLTELFSDCFAAIYFKNPKIISRSLFFTSAPTIHTTAKQRNFLNRNFQHLKNKKFKNIAVHSQFDKARHHLWKYYLSNAKYKNKPKVIHTILQIFSIFLHQKQSEVNFSNTDAIVANNLLISLIDKKFNTFYGNDL
ncbi:MAG: hypothetical protein HAW60_05860 [Bdellovibrionales bacterium]|nr:hypothetical protein [Bdellovibrionales bacterium]